ncbi:histidine kinase [Tessaracoccus caeni]|uniref:histidine kinase n=1 Tax=Tessaracoccus caeni TaxID=3031239 RepID=UPI0023DBC1B9|nr:histidine kinase [Tessaracoccus caeni]MDF1489608.1 histidine kinase [Tessaracoccus caeni]
MTSTGSPRGTAGRWAAATILTCAGVLVVVALVGLVLRQSSGTGPTTVPIVVLVQGCLPVGFFLVRTRPANRVGLLLGMVGVAGLLAIAGTAWSATGVGHWVAEWAWWPPWALLIATLPFYPEGAGLARTRRVLVILAGGAGFVGAIGLALTARLAPGLLSLARPSTGSARMLLIVVAIAIGVLVATGAAAIWDLVRRARRSEVAERSQLRALLPAAMLIVVGIVVEALGVPYATVPGLLAVPVGMGVAILTHHLDDLDLLVNRAVVWVVLTGCLFAAFGGTVALLSTTALAGQPLIASALGTAAVAVGFDPVRRRVQRAVDRWLFGDRDNPMEVLTGLGRRMQATVDPGDLLADLVAVIGSTLRVPFVRMEVRGSAGQTLTAVEDGRAQAETTAFEMRAQGEEVGRLLVAPRRLGEAFTPRETELLRDIAGQAAIAARSYRITLELRQARESLVRSREDERLRIRRDLHDGLGPAIAGARMQVAAARNARVAAPELLSSVQETLTECTQEVRRIVDGLRPGALDRGLVPAIKQRADAIGPVPLVTVETAGELDDLGAAVDVALFRIVTEALSNAARHSGAEHVWVRLDGSGPQVVAEVRDDGRGGAVPRDGGVGMESMRQRAEELGGELIVDSGAEGTSIRVVLPR